MKCLTGYELYELHELCELMNFGKEQSCSIGELWPLDER